MNLALITTYLKRPMVFLMVLCFAFTAVYVPQIYVNKGVPRADAQLAVVCPTCASLFTQLQEYVQDGYQLVQSTLSAGYNAVMAGFSESDWFKEYVLDGIGWTLAKNAVSAMQRSLVRWINSGFQGSPAFIQDLGGFLTNIADETMGQFIQELGGPFSIVCSPFQLNVRIALASAYSRSRDKNKRRCTLTGAMQNIQNFIGGDMSQGGWGTWLKISHQPGSYSQYGALLEASAEASIRITNAQGQQVTLANWGSGFLSSRTCEAVVGATGPEQRCTVTTPGRVIADQINHSLGAGQDALISADEINEVIGALLNQLVVQAVTGAQGLLGMGGAATKYTNPNFNVDLYTPGMETQANTAAARKQMVDSLNTESAYLQLGQWVMNTYNTTYSNDPEIQGRADAAYREASSLVPSIQNNVTTLQNYLAVYDSAVDDNGRQSAITNYINYKTYLISEPELSVTRTRWEAAFAGMEQRTSSTLTRGSLSASIALEREYLDLANDVIAEYQAKPGADAVETAAYNEARTVLPDIQDNYIELQGILSDYDEAISASERSDILNQYGNLKSSLHTESEVDDARARWEAAYPNIAP